LWDARCALRTDRGFSSSDAGRLSGLLVELCRRRAVGHVEEARPRRHGQPRRAVERDRDVRRSGRSCCCERRATMVSWGRTRPRRGPACRLRARAVGALCPGCRPRPGGRSVAAPVSRRTRRGSWDRPRRRRSRGDRAAQRGSRLPGRRRSAGRETRRPALPRARAATAQATSATSIEASSSASVSARSAATQHAVLVGRAQRHVPAPGLAYRAVDVGAVLGEQADPSASCGRNAPRGRRARDR
jgi:hypothetical protein